MAAGRARRRLRIGVDPALTRLPAHTSVARIWDSVLPRLVELGAEVIAVDPATRRRRFGRTAVDVWLSDGHQGPLPVPEPVVAHLHEASWAMPEVRPLLDPAFVAHYEHRSAAGAAAAARIITVSSSSRDQVVTAYGTDPKRIDVIPNGVDLATFHPAADPLPAARLAAAGGDPTRPYVLFVGTVHPRKHLSGLRDAMARLAADGHPHALVLVAGPAPDRPDSAELLGAATAPVAGRPVANLAGIDEAGLAGLMAGAAALCLPSFMEGFGMPVAEAMACATPVVVSDRGALPEVVGDAGVVVAPDAAAVAAGLARVLGTEEGRRLGAAGAERARARYGWDGVAERWLASALAAAGR